MSWFSGSKDVQKAKESQRKIVLREVEKNGGPISEDNKEYRKANQKTNDAIAASGKAVRWWHGG